MIQSDLIYTITTKKTTYNNLNKRIKESNYEVKKYSQIIKNNSYNMN